MPSYLFFGAIGLVAAFFVVSIVLMIRGGRKIEEMKKEVLAKAIPARAEILSVEHSGGASVRGGVRSLGLRVQLKVEHPSWGEYQAKSVWLVNELLIPQMQPEKSLPVLINREDPSRVYPNSEGMEFADWLFRRI